MNLLFTENLVSRVNYTKNAKNNKKFCLFIFLCFFFLNKCNHVYMDIMREFTLNFVPVKVENYVIGRSY